MQDNVFARIAQYLYLGDDLPDALGRYADLAQHLALLAQEIRRRDVLVQQEPLLCLPQRREGGDGIQAARYDAVVEIAVVRIAPAYERDAGAG